MSADVINLPKKKQPLAHYDISREQLAQLMPALNVLEFVVENFLAGALVRAGLPVDGPGGKFDAAVRALKVAHGQALLDASKGNAKLMSPHGEAMLQACEEQPCGA